MSDNFYDLLKYAATGQASLEMTHFDKMRALSMAGGKVETLTGIPPLSFKANGKPLISLSMLGNTQQTGTPTPDNIIMPNFCGVRTGNLFDMSFYEGKSGITVSGNKATGMCDRFFNIKLSIPSELYGQTLTWSAFIKRPDNPGTARLQTVDNGNYKYGNNITGEGRSTVSFTATSTIRLYCNYSSTGTDTIELSDITLNLGPTAIPYEPYGWAEKITNAGQTTNVYLGQTPTVRRIKKLVLDGTEDWINNSNNACCVLYINPIGVFREYNPLIRCSHVPMATTQGTIYNRHVDYGITFGGSSADRICIRNKECEPVADFKTWLASEYATGTPVCVWYVLATPETGIVNEPLAEIGDYADELHIGNEVTIPTVRGQNVLTVDSDLPPSEMTITYKK